MTFSCGVLKRKDLHAIIASVSGGDSRVEPPVPIPNTVVKRSYADDTALGTVWENRESPGHKKSSSVFR